MRRPLILMSLFALAGCGGGSGSAALPDTTPRPDLVIQSIVFTPDPPTTAGYSVTVTIANNGLADSPATTLVFSLIDGGVVTPLSTDPIPAIPALLGLTASMTYTFLPGGTPGTLDLRAVVTPVPGEKATSNNTGNVSTLVAPSGGG